MKNKSFTWIGRALGVGLLLVLLLPLAVLFFSVRPQELLGALSHTLFWPAFLLSLRTSLISLSLVVLMGLPLAYWLSQGARPLKKLVALVVDLPLVVPPAVIGVALLATWGRRGTFGPVLESLGIELAFSSSAVVLAQTVVSAPFFVQAAANAFRKVEPEMLIVARSLGASAWGAFFRVAVPVALPGLIAGLSLAWARALGEFGATLLFAGNLPGTTQTMPVAIFSALEVDLRLALAFSLILAGAASLLLVLLRTWPSSPGTTERSRLP